jgi:hypothetical protein
LREQNSERFDLKHWRTDGGKTTARRANTGAKRTKRVGVTQIKWEEKATTATTIKVKREAIHPTKVVDGVPEP